MGRLGALGHSGQLVPRSTGADPVPDPTLGLRSVWESPELGP